MAGNKYLVWKDPDAGTAEDNWLQMNGREFREFIKKPESRGRCFIRMGDEFGECGMITIESTREQYIAWKREQDRHKYLRNQGKGIHVLSTDRKVTKEDTLLDMLPGLALSPEEAYLRKETHDELVRCFRNLSELEKDLLRVYDNDTMVTTEWIAAKYGKSISTLKRKRKALKRRLRSELG